MWLRIFVFIYLFVYICFLLIPTKSICAKFLLVSEIILCCFNEKLRFQGKNVCATSNENAHIQKNT